MTMKFETETCSRCSGSGHFSYNQITGTQCFRCHGQKVTYTKRGQAALAYSRTLREITVADVEVGTRIYWGNGGRCTITAKGELKPSGMRVQVDGVMVDVMCMDVHGRDGFVTTKSPNETVRMGWTQDMIDKVTAYQANLTKAGTVRKRRINPQ